MLTTASGNLLQADVDALVNTVNTVGVMGKGIALQFKRAYPAMFADYRKACRAGDVRLGRMHVWETGSFSGPRYIINFPTKGHWRNGSAMKDIAEGLSDLVAVIRRLGITSIAVPPLGCGNGGLDWADVEPQICWAFRALPDVDVRIYPPGNVPPAVEMPSSTERPNMSPGRAALIMLVDRYSARALGASPIEVQKLMYFLQELGEPLGLKFIKSFYGPYADNLRSVLRDVEGHYLIGWGDGSAKVQEAEPITVLAGAVESALPVLEANPDTVARVERVMHVIEGFEAAYGMELLATVHWVAKHDLDAAEDWRAAAEQVRSWSKRKERMFSDRQVRIAWQALRDQELIGPVMPGGGIGLIADLRPPHSETRWDAHSR